MAFPSAVVDGTPVNFSFQSVAGIVIAGVSGILLQSANLKKPTKRVLVMDGNGNRTTSVHSDPIQTLTIKYKVGGIGLAAAIVNTTIPANGTLLTITSFPTMPDVAGGQIMEVINAELTGSNEDVKEITIDLEYAPNIQAAAAA
jgi:hypothetical protein